MAVNAGDVASGAGSGALTGAAVGSVVPGIGTVAGAAGGAIIGGGIQLIKGLSSGNGVQTSGGSVGQPGVGDGGPRSNFAYGSQNQTSTYANQYANAYGQQANALRGTAAGYGAQGRNQQALANGFYNQAMGSQGQLAPQVYANALDRQQQLASLGGLNSIAGQQQALAARGISANPALAQLNQGQDAAMRQSLAMAQSGHTIGGGVANYNAAQAQNAALNQQTNQQAAVLRANQDVQNAQFQANTLGAAGQAYGAAAGQANAIGASDNGISAQNAQLQQNQQNLNTQQAQAYGQIGAGINQNSIANAQLGANYQQLGMGYDQMANQVLGQQLQANMQYQNQINGNSIAQQNINNQQQAAYMNMVGTGAMAYANYASDVTAKKDIVPMEEETPWYRRAFLAEALGYGGSHSGSRAPAMVQNPNNPSQMISPYASIGDASRNAGPPPGAIVSPYANIGAASHAAGPVNPIVPVTPGTPPPEAPAPDTWGGSPYQIPAYDQSGLDAAYARQQADQANPYAVSDQHSKARIRELETQVAALGGPPSQQMLNQAAADQEAYRQRLGQAYRPAPPPPSMSMLNQAAAVQAGEPAMDLRPARGYSYEYKDPERHGVGRFYGPMAQDLEKTPAGASVVKRAPDGTKMVDTSRLSLVNTSAISEQQRKLQALQAQVNALGGSSPYPTPQQPQTIDLDRGMRLGGAY